MAQNATIYKLSLDIADMDRGYYAQLPLTVARHPSETEARMMLRILAFACYADINLTMTRGISTEQEPDIWQHNDNGALSKWIELGLPQEKRVKKACSLAEKVVLFCYGTRAAEIWWRQNQVSLRKYANLSIWYVDDQQLSLLAGIGAKNMQLQLTRQDGIIWLSTSEQQVELQLTLWKD